MSASPEPACTAAHSCWSKGATRGLLITHSDCRFSSVSVLSSHKSLPSCCSSLLSFMMPSNSLFRWVLSVEIVWNLQRLVWVTCSWCFIDCAWWKIKLFIWGRLNQGQLDLVLDPSWIHISAISDQSPAALYSISPGWQWPGLLGVFTETLLCVI